MTDGSFEPLMTEDYLPKHLDLFYNNEWHKPQDGEYREISGPGDGLLICKAAFAGEQDTVAALQAAKEAQPRWNAVPPLQRGKLLKKAAALLREHAGELAMLDALNIGSPVSVLALDPQFAAEAIDFVAGMIPAVTGQTHDLGEGTLNYTVREPLGVVARIAAYNHPLLFAASLLASPLAMGNTVVIKAAEQAPLSALRMAELIGPLFPPGVLNILSGGLACGKTLSTHPIVNKITLVGSLATGRAIQAAAAGTLKRTSFELGGKNALIAYPDADLGRLVDGVVAGMNWAWCGQSCGSMSRVFLHESLHDEVLTLVAEKVSQGLVPNNPLHAATTMGSMISKAAQARVLDYIEAGKREGARLVIGGKIPTTEETRNGFFVEPTIFADVTQDMQIAREEIFGPVLSVLRWHDEEKMLADVNSLEYGLTGALYTSSISQAHKTVPRIQAGVVSVNTVRTHFLGTPFGGNKQSGIGREECLEELYDMTQCKTVHVQL